MKHNDIELDFSQPRVMAILNVTPDSFYAGSRMPDASRVERRVREAVDEGAAFIDVGGYSSRPGADEVSPDEEWRRVELGVGAVRRLSPAMTVSVDTFRSEVAARAIEKFGPLVINDISAGELDPQMPAVAAKYGVPYIAMHMKGDPKTMQSLTDYKRDITAEVVAYFEAKATQLSAAGIRRENIVLDPGFGFAKTTEQNYELLAGLHRLCALGYPVLAGLSRKSMIYRALGTTPAESLAGTVALGWECLRQGAAILRVHDVREAADTIALFNLYEQNKR
ncbi:dihydropteroate synthase [uncultured Alistipes sp.]|uniref:dihydropteroate synthase n=1 Tax=uncultured Alistipes sp. TaxID=538949 RepID=UPI0025ECD90A|nr:dihydropteroate synthase [uncultured Alistipes sp.]